MIAMEERTKKVLKEVGAAAVLAVFGVAAFWGICIVIAGDKLW